MPEWIWRAKAMFGASACLRKRLKNSRLHYEMEVQAGVVRGLSNVQARRQARPEVGSVSGGIESTREEWGFRALEGAGATYGTPFGRSREHGV